MFEISMPFSYIRKLFTLFKKDTVGVQGIVSGQDQQRIRGTLVEFHREGVKKPINSPRSAADGSYAVEVEPGAYSISVELDGGRRFERLMNRHIRSDEHLDISLDVDTKVDEEIDEAEDLEGAEGEVTERDTADKATKTTEEDTEATHTTGEGELTEDATSKEDEVANPGGDEDMQYFVGIGIATELRKAVKRYAETEGIHITVNEQRGWSSIFRGGNLARIYIYNDNGESKLRNRAVRNLIGGDPPGIGQGNMGSGDIGVNYPHGVFPPLGQEPRNKPPNLMRRPQGQNRYPLYQHRCFTATRRGDGDTPTTHRWDIRLPVNPNEEQQEVIHRLVANALQ
jgi:hypothetical protein